MGEAFRGIGVRRCLACQRSRGAWQQVPVEDGLSTASVYRCAHGVEVFVTAESGAPLPDSLVQIGELLFAAAAAPLRPAPCPLSLTA